jgi:hypothetical protein
LTGVIPPTQKNSLYFLTFILELKTYTSPYLFLALDLPPPPLFQDAVEKNIIPQVSIHSVLAKYDGKTSQARSTLQETDLAYLSTSRNLLGIYAAINVNCFHHILSFTSNALPRMPL